MTRQHVTRWGTPKRRLSRDRVERHAAYLSRQWHADIRAYRCEFCGYYHLGNRH